MLVAYFPLLCYVTYLFPTFFKKISLKQTCKQMMLLFRFVLSMLQPRRLPRILHKYRYKLYSLLIILLTATYLFFKWNFFCMNIQAWQHVKKMVSFNCKINNFKSHIEHLFCCLIKYACV